MPRTDLLNSDHIKESMNYRRDFEHQDEDSKSLLDTKLMETQSKLGVNFDRLEKLMKTIHLRIEQKYRDYRTAF